MVRASFGHFAHQQFVVVGHYRRGGSRESFFRGDDDLGDGARVAHHVESVVPAFATVDGRALGDDVGVGLVECRPITMHDGQLVERAFDVAHDEFVAVVYAHVAAYRVDAEIDFFAAKVVPLPNDERRVRRTYRLHNVTVALQPGIYFVLFAFQLLGVVLRAFASGQCA